MDPKHCYFITKKSYFYHKLPYGLGEKKVRILLVGDLHHEAMYIVQQNSATVISSFVDPDPSGSAFIWLPWIRIRIHSTDPDPR
jgi:hypothetical protein